MTVRYANEMEVHTNDSIAYTDTAGGRRPTGSGYAVSRLEKIIVRIMQNRNEIIVRDDSKRIIVKSK